MADSLKFNCRWSRSTTERGSVLGVETCAVVSAKGRELAIPAKYTMALQELGRDDSIVIAQADKGGVLVMGDFTSYIAKMEALLSELGEETRKKNIKDSTMQQGRSSEDWRRESDCSTCGGNATRADDPR